MRRRGESQFPISSSPFVVYLSAMAKLACYSTKAYSATAPTAALGATTIERRQPTPTDVQIQILYCGVCHSDLHFARNEWGFTQYPAVPGHEIVGRVTAI